MKIPVNNTAFPCLEPPRCYLTSTSRDKRLSASASGTVSLSDSRQAWEEWRLFPSDDGIAVQSVAHGFYLQGMGNSRVAVSTEPDRWRVEPTGSGGLAVRLQSTTHTTNLAFKVAESGCVMSSSDDESETTAWTVEFLSGELCFMSSYAFDHRAKCEPGGELSMTSNWKGWEVWRFIEVGQGQLIITSWTHHSKVLCSDPDGTVRTTENKRGGWEKWTVERSPNGVLFKSVYHPGRFLCSDGKGLYTTKDAKAKGIEWCLEQANSHFYFLSSPWSDKRLSSKSDGQVLTSPNRKGWEEWEIKRVAGGWFTVKSRQFGKYLGSFSTGNVYTTTSDAKDMRWDIEESADGDLFIVSRHHHRQLVCDDKGCLSTKKDAFSPSATWRLEPCMPETITGGQLAARTGAIVAAVALTVAAPFAFLGVVGALGFGAQGIVGGTVAAGMMSAEAIAAGGAVVAGGTVATLQSIGAVGLGVAGITASAGGGAVLGGAVVGSTMALTNNGVRDGGKVASAQEDDLVVVTSSNRPLSNWRSW